MTIQTIPDIDLEVLVQSFNEAFAGYFVPVQVTVSQMRDKILNDGIDLSISIGVFDQDCLVGFILHGAGMMDGLKTVYNAGTGVLPSHRGQGLTRRMYKLAIPLLKNQGYELSVLEAITENAPAIKVYQSIGFEQTRTVHCFLGNVQCDKPKSVELAILPIKLSVHPELQAWWNYEPTWQYSWEAASRTEDQFRCMGAFRDQELVGYLNFHPIKGRIQQLAVRPDHRRNGVATSLIQFATQECSGPLSAINIDEHDSASLAFFAAMGLEELIGQIEMKKSLN